MRFKTNLSKAELDRIFQDLLKKNHRWAESLWHLVAYLIHIQFAQRGLIVTDEKKWDAATDIYIQLKTRIDCKERTKKDGTVVKPEPIKNIIKFVYFALPKRFNRWCEVCITREERDKAMLRLDVYDPVQCCHIENRKLELEIATELREDVVTREECEQKVIEWLGKAQNNMELKARRQKLRNSGWEIRDGKLEQLPLTANEMAKEISILQSTKEEHAPNEKRRQSRIDYLRGELDKLEKGEKKGQVKGKPAPSLFDFFN